MQQIYTNWSAVIVDAKSDDGTYNMLVEETSHFDNIEILRNTKRETALFNIILAIDKLKPDNEDILVFLDGDDWFYDSHVLEYLNEEYTDSDVWVTWGKYVTHPLNAHKSRCMPIPSMDCSIRKIGWMFSHLKTCKYFLWKNIKDEDLRWGKTGEYYLARDFAFMYPMLEMAGEHHRKFVSKILYVCNTENKLSDMYGNPKTQIRCAIDIRKRTPYRAQIKEQLL